MKKIIKIVIETKNDESVHNLTKSDVVTLQNIFEGDITQIGYTKELCSNCESRDAGKEYCEDCKKNDLYLFAIKQD